jgi:transposase-like protein
MSKISLVGQTKVSTLQKRFSAEFGLTIRIYDGRSFADPSATIGQIRRKQGAKHIEIRRNTKVGNLEQKFLDEAGIKVQIAGSDDSYLCDNNLTLKAALEEDNRKLANKRPTYSEAFKNEVVAAANEPGASMQEIADRFGVSYASISNWKQSNSADGEPNSVNADQTLSIPDVLRSLLNEVEEIVDEKGIAIQHLDFETYGVSLDCEKYEDDEYKVTIVISVEDTSLVLDEDTQEDVSDAVQDCLDYKLDFEERLENIGIDRETLSWWPVILEDVND